MFPKISSNILMFTIKTEKEIEIMAEGGKILREMLQNLALAVRPGITTGSLDKLARELVLSWAKKMPEAKIQSSFSGYRGYPAFLCVSVNDEVVHGVPSDRALKEGDIVGLDFGIVYKGFHTDSAVTVPVGKITKEAEKLIRVTREALDLGIEEARAGNTTGDIGHAVQKHVEKNDFSVVRELVGHGVGRKLHEEPYVPNYGKKGEGEILKEGMTIAIEPMVMAGLPEVVLGDDGFTYKTADGNLSAHFEHSLAVTKEGPQILT